ncbi:hypothetical protein BVRB_3g060150 [Beta vulgaris subsp. vulgaris]|nr:hypothetical protein BVRB_3g060150 [Beta vulgaris subsp. vulgaris]
MCLIESNAARRRGTICLRGFRYVKGVRMLNPVRAFEESNIPRQKVHEGPSKMEVSYSPRQSCNLLIPADRARSRVKDISAIAVAEVDARQALRRRAPQVVGAHWLLGSLEQGPSSPRVAWGSLAPEQPRARSIIPSSCLRLIGPWAASSEVHNPLELPGAHWPLGSLERGQMFPRVAWGSLAPEQPRARSFTPSSCLGLIGLWQPRARSNAPSSRLGLISP